MHVYHFGAYEPSTFKRLSGRYATRETELDTILRAELFVDLYTIVRHALKASVESYSIKDLERFYGLVRKQDLRAATASRHAIEWAIEMREDLGFGERTAADAQLELFDANAPPPNPLVAHVAAVELYNREDCVSAEKLRDWLERLRAGAERARDIELPRPQLKSGDANERIAATAEETQRVLQELIAGVPVDEAERSPEQHARWLMAHLLEWHRREDKAAWWEYYRLRDLPLEDYEEERSALAGLMFVGTVGGTARVPVNRYSFPAQDHDIRRKDEAVPAARQRRARRGRGGGRRRPHDRHPAQGRIARTSGRSGSSCNAGAVRNEACGAARDRALDRGQRHRRTGRAPRRARPAAQAAAAVRARLGGTAPRGRRTTRPRPSNAARARRSGHRVRRRAQRARAADCGADRRARRRTSIPRCVDAQRLGFELDHGVLPIQGPPGTGKTFTGAHMILELLKAGKKIGVSAVSHEAIRNLLRDVCELAEHARARGFQVPAQRQSEGR